MSQRSALGRVLGLGSAKEGASHWWAQRVSAVALLPLGLWFVFSVAFLLGSGRSDYLGVIDWIAGPVNAVMLILFIATVTWHSSLGVQVVIEDYVHGWAKVTWLVLQKFIHVVVAAASIFAVLKIALGS
ncbi:MAG: succinate dehydrogenase, hydrophobic membrane anchor protein [Gammaproteobacteria bacterium]|nr:succinate dehydrogenase, hydrophobic membrane anchor protein [Gammaproteobacteria bacterium]NNF59802.1 succinate dehydrogenase, hydrophobic membrane anchor protein [Gammaproteobacteria bacterium]NNM21324.1 succinate dehydrogenase, hydrophobic membrane anchor protein [Gammaproteobacteria bacterium]